MKETLVDLYGGPSIDATRSDVLEIDGLASKLMAYAAPLTIDPQVQAPWEFYASSFSRQLRGSDDWSLLHLSVTPNYLDWDHPQFGPFYFLTFANQIPFWQGRYAPSSLSFYEAYRFIVTSYAIEFAADPQLQKQARIKAYLLNVATRDYQDGWRQMVVDWASFDEHQKKYLPPHRWKPFDQWYADTWAKRLSVLRDRITIATAEYQSIMNQMGISVALLAEAINNVSNDAYFSRAKREDGAEFFLPGYSSNHNLGEFIDATKEALRKDPNHVGFDFKFDYSSGYYTESNTSFGASGTFSLGGGFALNVGGQWEEKRIDTKSKNFSVHVKFAGFQEFAVNPGQWFSPTVLRFIENGPWVENSFVDRWVKQGRTVWGANGLLPLETLGVYVGIQPRIKVSLASHEYSYYRRAYSAGAGVSFFGFRLGGGGGGSSVVNISWDDQTSSFEIVDVSGKPLVVGVRSQRMPA